MTNKLLSPERLAILASRRCTCVCGQQKVELLDHIAASAKAREEVIESAALIVDGADVSCNHLPNALRTPHQIAVFLIERDRDLATAIRALKDKP